MKINRSHYLALVAAIGGVAVACSSSPSTSGGSTDGGSSGSSGGSSGGSGSGSSSGSAHDAGSSSGGHDAGSSSGSGSSSGGSSGSSSGSGGCPSGETACGAMCCTAGNVCLMDSMGNLMCYQSCTDSTQCPASARCCDAAVNACIPTGTTAACRCTAASTCMTGCCAPQLDTSGNPVGPYVCKKNDGALYDCCNGTQTCNQGCCATSPASNGSDVCVTQCTTMSQCGAATCQSGTWTVPTFSACSNSEGVCAP